MGRQLRWESAAFAMTLKPQLAGEALAALAVSLDEAEQLLPVILLGDEHLALQGAAQSERT